jgi:hypothetical protein
MKLVKILKENKFIVFLAILCLLFFWEVLLHPTGFLYSEHYQSDLIEMHSIWYYYLKSSFEKFGYLPLWNHYVFSGVPFFATNFPLLFYPFTILFLFFPTDNVFPYYYMFNFFLGALFIYLLMRNLKLDKFSSFIAAIIYIFNARTAAYIFSGELNMMSMLILVPLIFLFSELAIQKNRIFYGIFAAIFVALIILGSHLQYVLYIYFFLFLYFFFRLYYVTKKGKKLSLGIKPTFIFIFIIILSILISSIQFLPNLELSKYHIRSDPNDYAYASLTSLPFKHLITLLIPNFFGSLLNDTYWGAYSYWSFAIYFGTLPLVLVFLSFFRKNKYILFYALMALLSLLIAFGKFTPVHYIFFKFVPGFDLFRVPARILVFFIFSMSILAGFGTNFLLSNKEIQYKKILFLITKVLVVVGIISLLGLGLIYVAKPAILSFGSEILKNRYSSSILDLGPLENYLEKIEPVYGWIFSGFLIFTTLIIAIVFLFILKLKNKISSKNFKILVFLIIIADLWIYSMPYINLKDSQEIFSKNDIIEFLDNEKDYYRVLDLTKYPYALPQHIANRYDIELLTGYDVIVLKRYYEFLGKAGNVKVQPSNTIPINDIANPQLVNLLNSKYIVSEKDLDDSKYELKFSNDNYNLYMNKNHLPRAFIVLEAIVLENKDEILNTLSREGFNIKKTVVLEEDPGINIKNQGVYKEATIDYYSPHKITIGVDMGNPGFLVLSEAWYPGWKAYDNNKEIKIYRADYILRAVYLEEGTHKVDFVFEPKSFKIGFLITIVTLLTIVFLLIVFWKYKI